MRKIVDSIKAYFREVRRDIRQELRGDYLDFPSEYDFGSVVAWGYAQDIQALPNAVKAVSPKTPPTEKLFWMVVELRPSSASDLLGDATYKVSH